ncbi:MAG: efflux RND transporter permease subunit, partial [Gemmatimonadales bacterium]
MSFSALFIKRPIMTTLVMAAILIFGIMGYRLLPVSDLPNVDFPTISVNASLSGASPETMAAVVATPLEKAFSTIPGLDQMTSSSSQGSTNVTLQFSLDRNIDAAAQDVQVQLSRAQRSFPQEMQPPSFNKQNPADSPILMLALSSRTLPLTTLDEYAETFLSQRISMVSGVAAVNVYGAMKYAVRVRIDPQAMASRGVGLDDVSNAINAGNVNVPNGILYGRFKALTLDANGQMSSAKEYRRLIVAYRNNSPVRLEDVAIVVDSVQNDKSASWLRDNRGIILAVQRQPGTNTVAVSDAVQRLVGQLKSQLPASVELRTLWDRSQSIRDSVADVKATLLLTLCL